MPHRFLKNSLALLLSLYAAIVFAGDFNGVVKKNYNGEISIAYPAKIYIKEGTKSLPSVNTFPDGDYKFSLGKSLSYEVRVSYTGFADTTFTFTTDKNGKPSAQNITVTLKQDGINLFGSVRTLRDFFLIKDVVVVLKNVMTRQERRVNTGRDGTYKFRLEYENNYRLSVDKRSDGIFNKFRDTVLYISTININQPMDYWLDIRLDEDREKNTEGIEGYDPMQPNKNVRPGIDVKNKTYVNPSPNSMENKSPTPVEAIRNPEPKPSIPPGTITDTIKKDSAIVTEPVHVDSPTIAARPLPPNFAKKDPALNNVPTAKAVVPKPEKQKGNKRDTTVIVTPVKPKEDPKAVKKAKKDSISLAAKTQKAVEKEKTAKQKEEPKAVKKDSTATASKNSKTEKEKPAQKKEEPKPAKKAEPVVAKNDKKQKQVNEKPEKSKPVEPKPVETKKTKKDSSVVTTPAKTKEKEKPVAKVDEKQKPKKEATPEKKKVKQEPTPAKTEPKPEIFTRTVAQVKADIDKAEKDLVLLKKKEVEVLKMAAYEKKQKEKNKGIEIVIIGENAKVTPEQVVFERQATEKKLKLLEEELVQVKKRKK